MNKNKSINLSINLQLIIAIIAAIAGAVVKVINYIAYYDNKTGLFDKNGMVTILDVVFYIALFVVIALGFTATLSSTPFYKKMKSNPPMIIGYALFFTAVMFVVQGLVGFYNHLTEFIAMRASLSTMDFWEYVPVIIPFLADIFCTMCAFSFYKMAMECFAEDDAPVRKLKSAVIPCIWGILTLLQVFLLTTNKLYVQNLYEQLLVGMLNVGFLYYLFRQFFTATTYHKKSTFALFIDVAFGISSLMLVFPYLILMLFGVNDSIPAMPYFAMAGISIYGIVVALNHLITAGVMQSSKK